MIAPRSTTLCAVAALTIGLAGCAGTPEPARTAVRTAATTGAPETTTGDALARIARQSLEAGDPESAVSMLKQAHATNPKSAPILAELGRTLAVLKAWQESALAYAKAAELAPEDPTIRRGHASSLLALDLPTLAEQEYRAALALHEDAPTLSGLGVTLDLQGRHDEALAAFRRALELNPEAAATRTNLGLSLALWGTSDEAIGLLAPMAAASTADLRQRQNLALAFGLAGDVDQARAVAKLDLGEEAVRNNLAYYETLRGLTPILRMRAVMGNHTVAAAGSPTTTASAESAAAPAATPVTTPTETAPPKTAPAKPSRAAERAPVKKPAEVAKVAKPAEVAKVAKPADVAKVVAPAAEMPPATTVVAVPAVVPSTIGVQTDAQKSTPDISSDTKAAAHIEPRSDDVAHGIDPAELAAEAASAIAVSTENTAAQSAASETVTPAEPVDTSNVTPEPATAHLAGPAAAPSDSVAPSLDATEPKAESASANSAETTAAALATAPAEAAPVRAEAAVQVAPAVTNDASEGAAAGIVEYVNPLSIPRQEASLPAENLPQVSVRARGVPLASVPQKQLPRDVSGSEDKDKIQGKAPVADADIADSASVPTAEPIKLLPRDHAANDDPL